MLPFHNLNSALKRLDEHQYRMQQKEIDIEFVHQPVGEQVSFWLEASEVARELVAELQLGLRLLVLVLAQLGRFELLRL